MPNLPNFELQVAIETNPAKHLPLIETAFDRAYKGERGDLESPNEFLIRKVQEYIAAIVTRFHVEDHMQGLSRDLQKQATEAIKINLPKFSPAVEPQSNLGENDPTFTTEPEAVLPASKAKRKR